MSFYNNNPYENYYGQQRNIYGNGNNYANPYQNQPNPYQMNNPQQVQNNQNMYNQPTMDRPRFLPLTFTNGVEGAKAYIVNPNSIMYILDSDNPILYEKMADYQGKYTLNAFKLEPIAVENIGKKIDTQQVANNPKVEYATKDDIKALQESFNQGLNKLFNDLENVYKKPKNNQNQQVISQEKGNK